MFSVMKCIALSVFIFSSCLFGFAQPQRVCHTVPHHAQLVNENPGFEQRLHRIDIDSELGVKSIHRMASYEEIVIPVVVHVVYSNSSQNISDAQIKSQIRVLNEDFGGTGDRSGIPARFRAVAAKKTGVRFQLASVDPQGNPTTGITRTRTGKFSFSSYENDVKSATTGGKNPWPTYHYLNIWVCNLSMGVLGYSQFPGGPVKTDGVVIGYRYFGRGHAGLVPPFNRGRTATHEIGHWLNLRHIWGDGPCANDLVEDTPYCEAPNQGCAKEKFSCNSWDMNTNFMDYTDDACMNMFTRGQAERMRTLFLPRGARERIRNSPGLGGGVLADAGSPVPDVRPKPDPYKPPVQTGPTYPQDLPSDPIPVIKPRKPFGLTASLDSYEGLSIKWNPVSGVEGYTLMVRKSGGDWVRESTRKNYALYSNYPQCQTIEYKVQSRRGDQESDFSAPRSINIPCPRPKRLSAESSSTSATLTWEPIKGIGKYVVLYRDAETREVGPVIHASGSRAKISGLKPNREYQFIVKARADKKFKAPFSYRYPFFTKKQGASSYFNIARLNPYREEKPRVSESPGGNYLNIEIPEVEADVIRASIVDMSGVELTSNRRFYRKDETFGLAIKYVPSGNYYLKLKGDKGYEEKLEIWIKADW